MPVPPVVTLIVARARNGVIGRDGQLPWHIPEELQHFKRTTLGHVLLMGRKTFESIGRPLPGRQTIVVSRDPRWHHAGCLHATTLSRAIALAGELGATQAFVAGGAQLYASALPIADRLLVTEVDVQPDGDAHFASPDPQDWECIASAPHQSAVGIGFTIDEYRRRAVTAAAGAAA